MTDERRDAPLTRYDFIPQRRVDFRISEYDGDWVRYADIKHLLVVTSRDAVLEEAAQHLDALVDSHSATISYGHAAQSIRALKRPAPQGGQSVLRPDSQESPAGGPAAAAPGDDAREGFYEKLWKDFCSLQSGDVQQMARDAARYRWLRKYEWDLIVLPAQVAKPTEDKDYAKSADELDAAMQRTKGSGG